MHLKEIKSLRQEVDTLWGCCIGGSVGDNACGGEAGVITRMQVL